MNDDKQQKENQKEQNKENDDYTRLLSAPLLRVQLLVDYGKPTSWQKVKVLTSKQNVPTYSSGMFEAPAHRLRRSGT